MSLVPEQTITLVKGDDREYALEFVNDDGSPRDVTGYTFVFTVKRGWNSSAVFVRKETGDGIEITDAAGGLGVLTISADDWTGYKGRGLPMVYDIEETSGNGGVRTILRGTAEVELDASN